MLFRTFAVYITLGVFRKGLSMARMRVIQGVLTTSLAFLACGVSANPVDRVCHGNIETFDQKVIKGGVTYRLSYAIDGKSAVVHFAGRKFDVAADLGTSWKGRWLKRVDDKVYFSFLPSEAGAIKVQLDADHWFSGNC